MSDLFDNLDFEVLGEDFEDPFESMAASQSIPPSPEMPALQAQTASTAPQKAESVLDTGADFSKEAPPPAVSETHAAEPADTEKRSPAASGKDGTSSGAAGATAVNMMAVLANEAETATAQQDARTLMELPPVFKYGACEEDITDAEMTFEQLRVEKEPDFLELEDSKRVTWTVQYGKVTKTISSPSKQKIAQVKEEIELSKEFLEGLKKAKDKRPRCFVKPTVAGKSKGIAAYKAILLSPEDAAQSPKPICIFPARDGRMYEMRKNRLGVFVTPTDHIHELSEVRAGFKPALPRIPHKVFSSILAFFRHYAKREYPLEVMVQIYWDAVEKHFLVVVPYQHVSGVAIDIPSTSQIQMDEERFYYYADIHSHNIMPAFFSEEDNRDERATRLYIVVGRLQNTSPDIRARISNGGKFLDIPLEDVVEVDSTEFPPHWNAAVIPSWNKGRKGGAL